MEDDVEEDSTIAEAADGPELQTSFTEPPPRLFFRPEQGDVCPPLDLIHSSIGAGSHTLTAASSHALFPHGPLPELPDDALPDAFFPPVYHASSFAEYPLGHHCPFCPTSPFEQCTNPQCPTYHPPAHAICFFCLQQGHHSGQCPHIGQSCFPLLYRSLSPGHLIVYREGRGLLGVPGGWPLAPGGHIGGGNVRIFPNGTVQWSSPCVWLSFGRLGTCTVAPTKAIGLIAGAACTIYADTSDRAQVGHYLVTPRWQGVAVDSSEVILDRVPHSAILVARTLEELTRPLPVYPLPSQAHSDGSYPAEAQAPTARVSWDFWWELWEFMRRRQFWRPMPWWPPQ